MVHKPSQQNPTQFGNELFPNVIQAPISVSLHVAESSRSFVEASGLSVSQIGDSIANYYSTNIQHFVDGARHQGALGGLEQQGAQRCLPGLDMTYQSNQGHEKLVLTVHPENTIEGLKNRFRPTGCYVLLQLFADDVTGTGHKHDVTIAFSKELTGGAEIVFARSDNIDTGTAFYEGVFLLKLPRLPLKQPAFSVTVSGVMDYIPAPAAGTHYEYACGAVVSQGWVGPGFGDTDGVWALMSAAAYNSGYIDAYFNSVGATPPSGFYLTKNVIWVRPIGGSDNPLLDDGWKVYIADSSHPETLTSCDGFISPDETAPASAPLPLGYQMFIFAYPLAKHVVFGSDKFFPIRKSVNGALSDGVDLWDMSNTVSNLSATLTDGTYSFAVERRQYLLADTGKRRRALMCYPTIPMISYTNGVIPYDVSGFRLQDDGTDLADGTAIFNAGGVAWVSGGIPSGPPPLLTTDPLAGEKVPPRLTRAELEGLPEDGTIQDFDSWT